MYTVERYNTIFDEKLKSHWEVLEKGEDMTAFQSYAWNCILEKEFKSNFFKKVAGELCYFELLDEGQPKLIAGFHIQKRTIKIGGFGYEKGIYFLGMRGYSDYLNFIYKDINANMLNVLLQAIFEYTKIAKIYLSQLPEASKTNMLLQSGEVNFTLESDNEEVCVKLSIPETPELFVSGMKKQFKQNYRTQKHRYEREHICLDYTLYQGCVQDREILACVKKLHKQRFKEKNKGNARIFFSSLIQRLKGHFDEIGHALKEVEHTWLLVGKINNKVVSYIYGMSEENVLRIMQLGFDKKYAQYSPGIMILIEAILNDFDSYRGKIIDFTRGEEAYKYRMGGVSHSIKAYTLYLQE